MSAEGLDRYARGQAALEALQFAEAVVYLRSACCLLPAHASAHHLLGKALAQVGCHREAEAVQSRSCVLDPALGWNWFALAELQEHRLAWQEAADAYTKAMDALPDQSWIREKAIACHQREALGGTDIRAGLSKEAYRLWCEQCEPRLPSSLVPLQQHWVVLTADDDVPGNPLPLAGWLVLLGPGFVLRSQALQALEHWLATGSVVYSVDPCFQFLQQGSQSVHQRSQPDLIGCDEDRLDGAGCRVDPWFKPGALAESSWSTPWLAGLSVWSFNWLRLNGLGWPPNDAYEREAWLWRALLCKPRYSHMPLVLTHASSNAVETVNPEQQAALVFDYLKLSGEKINAVYPHPERGRGLVLEWVLPKGLRCSLIVPTRDHAGLLNQCLLSLSETTKDSGIELDWIVIDNGSKEMATRRCLAEWKQRLGNKFRVIKDDRAFNWSNLNNRAAGASSADLLLFLNNDVEAIHAGWLETMAAQAVRSEVGCVGAVLLYPDGSLQHAGVVVGMHGGADHAYRGLPPNHNVHRGRSCYLSDWGAVTGACLMVERDLFHQVGGFDSALPVEFNDVDFCLRLTQLGYRHVVDPSASLIHHESQSRDAAGSATARAALDLMQNRWLSRMNHAAPWWPSACSRDDHDGRPLGLECVRSVGPIQKQATSNEPTEKHCGHVDHLWCLGEGHFVVAGWSSDLRSEAALKWKNLDESWQCIPLGNGRIRRPVVAEALGVISGDEPDYGFLVAFQASKRDPAVIRLGDSEVSLVSQPLIRDDVANALQTLLDACHWGNTPPEKCSTLLSEGLGQALLWLRDQQPLRRKVNILTDLQKGSLALMIELDDDPDFSRCRLWQMEHHLQHLTDEYPLLLSPAKASLWARSEHPPLWLERLITHTGLLAQIVFPHDSLPCDWLLLIGAGVSPRFLGDGLTSLWLFSQKLLTSRGECDAEMFVFSALPDVCLIRSSAVRLPLEQIKVRVVDYHGEYRCSRHGHRTSLTRSRRSWLRAVDRWLIAVANVET